jgi:hypothetical protein
MPQKSYESVRYAHQPLISIPPPLLSRFTYSVAWWKESDIHSFLLSCVRTVILAKNLLASKRILELRSKLDPISLSLMHFSGSGLEILGIHCSSFSNAHAGTRRKL